MNKSQIKNILKEVDIKANKILGQNFLINQGVVEDMLEAADIKDGDTVLEVGPGLGILTKEIIKKNCKILAIEKDKNLIPYLENKFKDNKNIEIRQSDILREKINFKDYKIIANLPFYLTSRFLRIFLEYENKPSVMVLLMQREVAERVIAENNNTSVLSIACSLYADAKIIRSVSRRAFYPKPDVDCAVIKFNVFDKPKYKIEDIELFFKIVKAGFSARRKQIHNNLSSGLVISGDKIKNILEKAKIDPTRRAQTLSLEEWVKLYEFLSDK